MESFWDIFFFFFFPSPDVVMMKFDGFYLFCDFRWEGVMVVVRGRPESVMVCLAFIGVEDRGQWTMGKKEQGTVIITYPQRACKRQVTRSITTWTAILLPSRFHQHLQQFTFIPTPGRGIGIGRVVECPMAAYKSTTTRQYHHDTEPEDDFVRPKYHSPAVSRSSRVDPDLDSDDDRDDHHLHHDHDDDDDMNSPELTPTTFSRNSLAQSLNPIPTGLMTLWTADQVADWVAAQGLSQYADAFVDEAITGLALVEMQHNDFKEMGIMSVGHRLTLLRGVYDIKIKQDIPLDPDHYIPLC
jgi:hypothetical protein